MDNSFRQDIDLDIKYRQYQIDYLLWTIDRLKQEIVMLQSGLKPSAIPGLDDFIKSKIRHDLELGEEPGGK